MYYPSIPLSLSMPVAWPQSSHPAAHPGHPPETPANPNAATYSPQRLSADDVYNSAMHANQAPMPRTQPSPISEKDGDTSGLPLASVEEPSRSSCHTDGAGQQDSTKPHSALDIGALKGVNEAHRVNLRNSIETQRPTNRGAVHSPLLDEIINHTKHLKTLA